MNKKTHTQTAFLILLVKFYINYIEMRKKKTKNENFYVSKFSFFFRE
jgi:hypothetical protein